MTVRRLNVVTGKLTQIEINNNWKIATHANDEDIINCVHCGQPIKFKDSFKSFRYLNLSSVPFRECKECFDNYEPIYNMSHT